MSGLDFFISEIRLEVSRLSRGHQPEHTYMKIKRRGGKHQFLAVVNDTDHAETLLLERLSMCEAGDHYEVSVQDGNGECTAFTLYF